MASVIGGLGVILNPTNELMPASVIYEDTSLAGLEGLVIDPTPLSRGDHAVARYWRHPQTCETKGGVYPYAPPPPNQSPRRASHIGVDNFGTWRIRGLLVTGSNSGLDDDVAAWNEAFTALGAKATHMHRPTAAELETALAGDICKGVNELESVVVVLAGRGSPVAGGSLILDKEALPYGSVGQWLSKYCSEAASHIWVIDSSYAGLFTESYVPGVPTLIWRASTAIQPNAPRVRPLGGGLLSQALAFEVGARAAAHCLGEFPSKSNPGKKKSIHPSTHELWDVFRPEDLHNRMRSIRWQNVGVPAVENAETLVDTFLYQAFLRDVMADIPEAIFIPHDDPNPTTSCISDEECELVHAGCDAGPCHTWDCFGGQCRLVVKVGESCDDDNPCTVEDRCDSGGICSGDVDICSDGDACTLDTCLLGAGCVHSQIPADGACNDDDPCTETDRCDASHDCAGVPAECEDGDPCTGTECDALEGCTFKAAKGPCDDGLACTYQDYCKGGRCLGIVLPCDDSNACTVDSCDEELGACQHAPVEPGAACSDGLACTTADACQEGVCVGSHKNCDDGIPCTTDYCSDGGCVSIPEPATCLGSEGCIPVGESPADNACLVCAATNEWEELNGGGCADDGIECTVDTCSEGVCTHPNADETCLDEGGNCVQVGESMGGCLLCVSTGVAAVADAGEACDDGDPCTGGDLCTEGGFCEGEALPCCILQTPLGCGETTIGDTEFGENLQSNWGCMEGFNFKGNEGTHTFVAECDGPVSVNITGLGGAGVLLVEGGIDQCTLGECSAFSQLAATLQLTEGQELTVVVDSFGANGLYSLMVQCDCGP